MLNDQFGIINDIMLNLCLISQKIAWTASTDTAMCAIPKVDIWKSTPFRALLILAGLQMVPRDIYEAAKIDEVNPARVFFKITLPLIRPALAVAIIFRMLDGVRIFELVYVLTPNSAATKIISNLILRESPLVSAIRTASLRNSSVLPVAIVLLLCCTLRDQRSGTKP